MENEYRILEPEVAGGFGTRTVLNHSTTPPTVELLHYEFGGWLGDELVSTSPCFIVTSPLRDSLLSFNGTGYSFGDVIVSKSAEFEQRRPEVKLPDFSWLKISGSAGSDDIGLGPNSALVVSDLILNLLRTHEISHCLVRRRPFRKK